MRFEHLIEINDENLPLIPTLTRAQLWRGLTVRAERPQLFVIGLDQCRIIDRDRHSMSRELRFGALQVFDRVSMTPMQRIVHDVSGNAQVPPGRLTIDIEEPEPQRLFLRFVYSNDQADPPGEADDFYDAHLKQAYRQADIDTVKVIRDLAAQGLLDGPD
jgi:Domain of unknown function (DUF1857)